MNLRSRGPPEFTLDEDLHRTLRELRRGETSQAFDLFDSSTSTPSPTSSGSSTFDREEERMATFGDYGRPEAFVAQSGIKEPENTSSFQIHPQYKRAVKDIVFSGLDHECPLDHLENFMEECRGASNNQVTDEYVYLKLFHYTLAGNAKRWLRSLPPNSLEKWEDVTTAFLEEFYSEEKSYEARRKLTLFAQEDDESLPEAWSRFRDLTRKCPHHKLETGLRIGFFYDGLSPSSRAALDSGAGGSLRNIPLAHLEATINKVVKNCPTGSRRRARKDKGSSGSSKEDMAEMAKALVKELGLSPKKSDKVLACDLCGMDNHTRDYCGGRSPEHIAAVFPRDSQGQGPRNFENQGYNQGPNQAKNQGGEANWYQGRSNFGGNQGFNQGYNQGFNRGYQGGGRGNFGGGFNFDQGGAYPNPRPAPIVTFPKEPPPPPPQNTPFLKNNPEPS